mmetsp:Transcript_3511/g.7676  ORF Transcript_3511/g.7676 Transcript_3511/m.7676 type:complete len:95 (+) Transcript_3511:543-827(+)
MGIRSGIKPSARSTGYSLKPRSQHSNRSKISRNTEKDDTFPRKSLWRREQICGVASHPSTILNYNDDDFLNRIHLTPDDLPIIGKLQQNQRNRN